MSYITKMCTCVKNTNHLVDIESKALGKQYNAQVINTAQEMINPDEDLYILSGSLNMPWGVYRKHVEVFNIIQKAQGNIYYIFVDKDITLHKCMRNLYAPSIIKKVEASGLFDYRGLDREYYFNKITAYITQGRDIEILKDKMKMYDESKIIFGDPYKWPLYSGLEYKEDKEYDLIFGVISYRTKAYGKILKEILSHVDEVDYRLYGSQLNKYDLGDEITITPKVDFDQYMKETSKSLCTIIVADPWYFNNFTTSRIYETIICNTIPVVYSDYDKDRFFNLPEELYFKDGEGLIETINWIKTQNYDELLEIVKDSLTTI